VWQAGLNICNALTKTIFLGLYIYTTMNAPCTDCIGDLVLSRLYAMLKQENLALASMARDDLPASSMASSTTPASSTAAAMRGKVGSEFET